MNKQKYLKEIKDNIIIIWSHIFHFNINVEDNLQTIDDILNNNSSVIRMGDGEFAIIRGEDIYYQKYNKKLATGLESLILQGSTNKKIVCLPDVFSRMSRYTKEARKFYYVGFFYENRKLLKKISHMNKWYGSTFISRPYLDLKNKGDASLVFNKLRQIWDEKDILIVEGKYSRSGEGNDLFDNAKSVKRIICPSTNAFDFLKTIESSIKKYSKGKLVLLMLGPTAKIIVNDLANENRQLIDLGHIDSEYEWYRRKAKTRIPISYKHTAEVDGKVQLKNDPKFNNEIVDIIE